MQHLTSKLARLITPLLLAVFVLVQVAGATTYVSSKAHDGYTASVDGLVLTSVIQSDGKVILGGRFTQWTSPVLPSATDSSVALTYPRVGLARFDVDGMLDTSYYPALNGAVTAMALQADGSLIIGGEFTLAYYDATSSVGSTTKNLTRTHLARILPSGEVDLSFEPVLEQTGTFAADFKIASIAIQQDGKILIGGRFNQYSKSGTQTTVLNLVRLNADGTLDTTLNQKPNEVVTTILPRFDGSFFIGGGFTTVTDSAGTALARLRMAHILADGTVDTAFAPKFNNRVNVVTTTIEGHLVVGGMFTRVEPTSVSAISDDDSKYLRFLIRLDPATGEIVRGYYVNLNAEVFAITKQKDGRLLIGGNFTNILFGTDSTTYTLGYMARLLSNGEVDSTFAPYFNAPVSTITVQDDGKIIAGGYFTGVRGANETYSVKTNHVARLYSDGSLDSDFVSSKNGTIAGACALPEGGALLYGSFTNLSGITRTYMAKISATGVIDSAFAPVIDGTVSTVYLQSDGKILIGGSFYTVNSVTRKNMARLNADGSLDTTFSPPNPDGAITAFEVQDDGKVIVGGEFLSLTKDDTVTTRYYIARLSSTGDIDSGFDPRASGTVRAIKVRSDGRIYVGGSFYSFNPNGGSTTTARYYLALLLGDGTVDTGFDPSINNEVYSLQMIDGDRIIISGNFSGVAATTAGVSNYLYYVAIVNIKGEADANFNPIINSSVYDILIQSDGKYVLSGAFTTVAHTKKDSAGNVTTDTYNRKYTARLESDGNIDTSYDPNPNSIIYKTVQLKSGSLLAVGAFSTFTPNKGSVEYSMASAALLSTSGIPDSSFSLAPSASAAGTVNTISRMSDGRFVVTGSFAGLGGSDSTNIARYYAAGNVDTTLTAKPNAAVRSVATWPLDDSIIGKYASYSWLASDGLTYKLDPNTTLDIDGTINVVHPLSNGQYLIGGLFTVTGYSSAYDNLIRVNADGSLDTSFKPTPDAAVYTIAEQTGGYYVLGGNFTTLGGTTMYYLGRVSTTTGALDTSFNPHPDAAVIVVKMQTDGLMVVGGNFTTVYGSDNTSSTTTRDYIVRLKANGNIDTGFDPNCNGQVNDLVIQEDGDIVLGGLFTYLTPNSASSSTARSYLARINSDATIDTSYYPTPNSSVNRIKLTSDEQLYVVGNMTTFTPNGATSSTARYYAARLNKDGTVDSDFNPVFNGAVTALAVQSDGHVVVGGDFTRVDDVYRNRLARLAKDGTLEDALVPLAVSTINDIEILNDGSLFIASKFSKAHFKPALLIGGAFTQVGESKYPYLARLFVDGVVDPKFVPVPNAEVFSISRLADGTAVVVGDFTSIGGGTAQRIAKLSETGTLDSTFTASADAAVRTICALPDGRFLIGGSFTSVNGVGRSRIAMIKADGTLDTSFSADANGDVTGIEVSATGYVYVVGSFTSISSNSSPYFARLNLDGSPAVFSGATALSLDGVVNSIAVAVDGSFVLGGKFTKAAGQARAGLVRVNADGSIDPRLNIAVDGQVGAVYLDEDGKLLMGGSFSTVDKLPRFMIARLAVLEPCKQTLSWNADSNVLTWARRGGLPNVEYATVEYSMDGTTWNTIGRATSNGDGSYSLSGVNINKEDLTHFRVRGPVRSAPYGGQGFVEQMAAAYRSDLPTFSLSSSVLDSQGATISISGPTLTAGASITVSGLPAGVTYDAVTNTVSGTVSTAGTYTVTWTVTDGFTYRSFTQVWVILGSSLSDFTPSDSQRMMNISSRVDIGASDVAISGFVISGSAKKRVLIRAVGPTLKTLDSTIVPVAQPKITVYNASAEVLTTNSGWANDATIASESTRLGAFALDTGSKDSALILTLAPGAYTVHVSDIAGIGGTILSEIYDASVDVSAESQRLVNLSSRANVKGSSNVLIVGFVVSGATQQRVLIRAVGPAMSSQNVTDYLPNPTLTVYQGGTEVAGNDDWQTQSVVSSDYLPLSASAVEAARVKVGAFAYSSGSKDAAMVLTLKPGAYSFVIRSKDASASGSAMGEVYQIQP